MLENGNVIELSVVIPCYNSEKSLPELNERLNTTLKGLVVNYEIIYVNDSSQDNTKSILVDMASNNKSVVAVDLMSNVGQFRTLICGLEHARGNYVVTMDDDLQHPPEEIVKLYSELKNNSDLDAVIGIYKKKEHPFIRNFGSNSAQKFRGLFTNKKFQASSFRCMTKPLVNAVVKNKTIFSAISLIIFQVTNNVRNIEVDHHLRKYDKSNYSFFQLMNMFFAHLFSNTNLPLRFVRALSLVIFAFGIILFFYYLIGYFMGRILFSEWRALIIFINIYTGLLLLSIGVIGEYIYIALQEVKSPPRYNVREIYWKKE
jgi:glycosyltransferase involved in cell wall biosynthesis